MCGIFGVCFSNENEKLDVRPSKTIKKMFAHSKRRGKDTSGLVVASGGQVQILRSREMASSLMKSKEFQAIMAELDSAVTSGIPTLVIGHTRMVTHGGEESIQPVLTERYIAAHNGIFLSKEGQATKSSDTQLFFESLHCNCLESFQHGNVASHLRDPGGNSAIWLELESSLWGYESSNGNLFAVKRSGRTYVASEPGVITALGFDKADLHAVKEVEVTSLGGGRLKIRSNKTIGKNSRQHLIDSFGTYDAAELLNFRQRLEDITRHGSSIPTRRCARCILPDTFPGITFDNHGVCSECKSYVVKEPKGEQALLELLSSGDPNSPVLVPISGGRDSSFAVAKVQELTSRKVLTYTYDWGFVSSLARRNISAICGSLEVENLLIAADINKKRQDVRLNLKAWCRKPSIAVVPILMAGDKAFFHWAGVVAKERKASPIIFSMNWLEKTNFKVGFATSRGVRSVKGEKLHSEGVITLVRLVIAYLFEFIRNPRLVNRTLLKTAVAFWHFYLRKKDYLQLFDFLEWTEEGIESVITKHGWRGSNSRSGSWRVGDATSSFYNLAYIAVAGFTENDTFLSNQIRVGQITRDSAMKRIGELNKPDVEGLLEYLRNVDLHPEIAISALEKLSRS